MRPCQRREQAGHVTGRDLPRAEVEVLGGLRELGLADDLVELDAERIGDQRHRLAEDRGAVAAIAGSSGSSIGRANPAGNSVAGESYSVVSASSTTVTLSIRSQTVAATMARSSTKPGLTPLPNIDEPPRSHASTMRSRSAPSPLPLMNAAVLTTLTPASRIRTSSSTSGHIGVYTHAVGLQGEQRIHVVGGGDADGVHAAELADVAPDLVGGPRVAPDQLELRVREHGADGSLADVAGGPLHDAHCHLSFPRCRAARFSVCVRTGQPILRKSQLTILSGRMRSHACRPSWCTCPPAYLSA